MKHCKDCDFWVNGECRKKAPVVITDGYEKGSTGHLTVWPVTNASAGCGEGKRQGEGTSDPPICSFSFSVRTLNCLDSANIKTMGELKRTSDRQLLHLRNFGPWCLREVRNRIAEFEQEQQI